MLCFLVTFKPNFWGRFHSMSMKSVVEERQEPKGQIEQSVVVDVEIIGCRLVSFSPCDRPEVC